MEWSYWVTGVSVSLVAFLVWKEVNRARKTRLLLRVGASVLAVLSLVCITLPPVMPVKFTGDTAKPAILLTDGYQPDSIRSFLSGSARPAEIYTADAGILNSNRSFKIHSVADLAQLIRQPHDFNALHLFGYGLNRDELASLNKTPVQFHPSPVPSGIRNVSWMQKVFAGELLSLQGNFHNALNKKIKLVLKGLNTTLDSTEITAAKDQDFALSTVPKHAGRAVYELIALSGSDTLQHEEVSVEIEPPGTLKVLILAASPDFENRFLKNWLSEHRYSVAVRSRISKNKFDREYLNSKALALDNINLPLLRNFDIVLCDAAELNGISKPERSAIRTQLEQGMGLIIKTDTVYKDLFYSKTFPLVPLPVKDQKPLPVQLTGNGTGTTPGIIASLLIKQQEGTQPLVTQAQSRILASSSISGSGKMVLTTISNSYSWILAGRQDAYSALWTMLLSRASRKIAGPENWITEPSIPFAGNPVTLYLETSLKNDPLVKAERSEVYFKQNAELPFRWEGTYWPSKPGWQPIRETGGKTNWIYISSKTGWKNTLSGKKVSNTRNYAQKFPIRKRPGETRAIILQKPVPATWFFLVFLVCCSFLWIEGKFSGN